MPAPTPDCRNQRTKCSPVIKPTCLERPKRFSFNKKTKISKLFLKYEPKPRKIHATFASVMQTMPVQQTVTNYFF